MPIPVYATPVGVGRHFSTSARIALNFSHSVPLIDASLYPGLVNVWTTIEYSDDEQTWTPVRGCDKVYPDQNGKLVAYDYEAPPQRARMYRSYVLVELANGDIIPGDISNIAIATMYLKSVWVKDVYEPELNFTIPVDPKWLTVTRNKNRNEILPLGRTWPVIIGKKGSYHTFSMKFTCLGDGNWANIQTLMESQRTLLLQTPKNQWYVQPTGSPSWDEDLFSLYEENARLVNVNLVEVEPV